ncbi:MAG: phosphomethylpyrimidine synthase ThiC, partial [Methanosarcinales archaeon]|nr:phosphomethylpyrimidine synthase ThiC [Methanosarcinales archaeon]
MTLLDRARSHEITEEIRCVAEAEGIDAEKLRRLVAAGRVVIP